MTGFVKAMRVGPIGPWPASLSRLPEPAARAFRSKPAQKRPRLVIGSRSARAAEWLQPDHGTGRLVIDVEVAGRVDQLLGRLADRLAVAGEDRPGESVGACPVAQVKRLVKLAVCVRIDGEDGAEKLLAQQLEIGVG